MAAGLQPPASPQEWLQYATLSLGLLGNLLNLIEGLVTSLGNQPAHVAQLQVAQDAHARLAQSLPAPGGP